ncbi:MAG: hypothetical protein HYX75_20670 [Acidobacteria bacterium]|nr:hypothetical protein [Acidobacteriota bacterium]
MSRTPLASFENLSPEEVRESLAYAGLVLVAFELVKIMIVNPIKAFYAHTTFGERMPFKSYDEDVLSRHKNEFEACLLYLRDFMGAINSEDLLTIQALRKHRNDLAHDLVQRLPGLRVADYQPLLENVNRTLFKLSNHRTRMEIGADPELRGWDIDWETVKGHEYLLFEHVVEKVRLLRLNRNGA